MFNLYLSYVKLCLMLKPSTLLIKYLVNHFTVFVEFLSDDQEHNKNQCRA